MGYCYQGRKLCCDLCGKAGARKKRCPYGYCPSTAVCPSCSKDPRTNKKAHKALGCERRHEEYAAREAARLKLLTEGAALRCSARGDASRVHVLFERADGSCEGRYMSNATYAAIPLGENATPSDYEKHGEVLSAPSDYTY